MDIKIALLTIGTEIVSGLEADTNSHYLSRELFNHGFIVDKHISVGDAIQSISRVLREIKSDYQIIITTGGIGPTDDDLTRESIAEAFNFDLILNEELFEKIRGQKVNEKYARKLASFPQGAQIIQAANQFSVGGFFIEVDDSLIITLPGVPLEIKAIFHQNVLPIIDKRFKPEIPFRRRLFKLANLSEVQVEERLQEIKDNFSYGLLPKPGEVHLYVTTKGENVEVAQQKLESIDSQLIKIYGQNLFGRADETLEKVIVEELIKNKLTVAVAESSTGGLIGQRLSSIAGASAVFAGGFIAYSNSMKEKLGVSNDVLRAHGAVSEQVAIEMAGATQAKADSDIAVSVTGIAGPTGATGTKSIGLHYIALKTRKGQTLSKDFIFRGTREQIRWQASQQALVLLHELISFPLLKGRAKS